MSIANSTRMCDAPRREDGEGVVLLAEQPSGGDGAGLLYDVAGPCAEAFLRLTALPSATIAEMRSVMGQRRGGGSLQSPVSQMPLAGAGGFVLSVVEVAVALAKARSPSPITPWGSTPSLHVEFVHGQPVWCRFIALVSDAHIAQQVAAYGWLAERGWRLRHGGRFGAHFLAYRSEAAAPGDAHSHAEVLVWVQSVPAQIIPPVTAVFGALCRVARSASKRVLVITPTATDDGSFIETML